MISANVTVVGDVYDAQQNHFYNWQQFKELHGLELLPISFMRYYKVVSAIPEYWKGILRGQNDQDELPRNMVLEDSTNEKLSKLAYLLKNNLLIIRQQGFIGKWS